MDTEKSFRFQYSTARNFVVADMNFNNDQEQSVANQNFINDQEESVADQNFNNGQEESVFR